ncbi:MAG: hypothetical protein AAGH65_11270 [Pseudomonadota bacterium]
MQRFTLAALLSVLLMGCPPNSSEPRVQSPVDIVRPDWSLSDIDADRTVLYRVGHYLAESGQWPNGYPRTEFRAVRDQQRPDEQAMH